MRASPPIKLYSSSMREKSRRKYKKKRKERNEREIEKGNGVILQLRIESL
jgi:hypothetical protein